VAASQEVRALVAAETANANGDAAEAERRALGDWIRDAAGRRACHQDRRVFTTIFRRYASGGDADTSSRGQARYSRTRLACSRSSASVGDPVSSTATRRWCSPRSRTNETNRSSSSGLIAAFPAGAST
jgi:hypothetical protein